MSTSHPIRSSQGLRTRDYITDHGLVLPEYVCIAVLAFAPQAKLPHFLAMLNVPPVLKGSIEGASLRIPGLGAIFVSVT